MAEMVALIFESGRIQRALDAHSGLCALVAERSRTSRDEKARFDALWAGSLGAATVFGMPDNGSTPFEWRLQMLDQIKRVSTLPILFDAENGGGAAEVAKRIKALEQRGVSAVVLEDRSGPKSNSYAARPQDALMPIGEYSKLIQRALDACRSTETQIIARLEGLIFGRNLGIVVERALSIEALGAHAILLHSKSTNAVEVLETARLYRRAGGLLPLIAVPTSYASVTERELESASFGMAVYANQLTRGALKQMTMVAERLLDTGRCADVDGEIAGVQQLLAYLEPDA